MIGQAGTHILGTPTGCDRNGDPLYTTGCSAYTDVSYYVSCCCPHRSNNVHKDTCDHFEKPKRKRGYNHSKFSSVKKKGNYKFSSSKKKGNYR